MQKQGENNFLFVLLTYTWIVVVNRQNSFLENRTVEVYFDDVISSFLDVTSVLMYVMFCLNVSREFTSYWFQRFNVAITRAKALLIVIGNPNILSRDESWHQ